MRDWFMFPLSVHRPNDMVNDLGHYYGQITKGMRLSSVVPILLKLNSTNSTNRTLETLVHHE